MIAVQQQWMLSRISKAIWPERLDGQLAVAVLNQVSGDLTNSGAKLKAMRQQAEGANYAALSAQTNNWQVVGGMPS